MGRAQSKIAFGRVRRPSQGTAIWIDSAGGFVAGLLVSLKSSGVPWWALGAVQRRWRFLAAARLYAAWLLWAIAVQDYADTDSS